ncbi:MAG: hypothetical protein ABI565_06995 [Vicinamibacteria bacterium]
MMLGTLITLTAALAMGEAATSTQQVVESLRAEVSRERKELDELPSSPFLDGERPRLKGLLDDTDVLLKAARLNVALESLSSTSPGIIAMSRASTGWDDTGKAGGKGIDALAKEWAEVGVRLKADRPKFPATAPKGQSMYVRALAEQSLGQIDESYAVAVDYGRVSGATFGAYYVGRAEGQMAFALFLSRLDANEPRAFKTLPSLSTPIARIEDEIVAAYAKPGSTAQHNNFIIANSSLKLAKELNRDGRYAGALATVLRSLFALGLATLPAPPSDQEAALTAKADDFAKTFGASKRDESIGEAFLEKARIALEKSKAGGEAGERERLRAAALVGLVLPRYEEIMKGAGR